MRTKTDRKRKNQQRRSNREYHNRRRIIQEGCQLEKVNRIIIKKKY